MRIEFEQTSKKKRRWLVTHTPQSNFPWFTPEIYHKIEYTLFEHNENCRILKERHAGIYYVLHVEFKNDADEAAFILWASGGIEIEMKNDSCSFQTN